MSTITGSSGNDSQTGTTSSDTIYGGSGNDTQFGGDGNDRQYGGWGNDTLSGNAGDDSLVGETGADTMFGGAGNDTLSGGVGNDSIEGGDGNDTLRGDSFTFVAQDHKSTSGGQTVQVSFTNSTTAPVDVYWIDPNGTLSFYGTIPAGASGSATTTNGQNAVVMQNGTMTPITVVNIDRSGQFTLTSEANDTLRGGTGNDTIFGDQGNDSIAGDGGDDTLYGGTGNDVIGNWQNEGAGNDLIYGGAGDDQLIGGGENDTVYGDAGNDFLSGGIGADTLFGGDGADNFWLTEDHQTDTIFGGEGGIDNDFLVFSNWQDTSGVTATFSGSESGTYGYANGGATGTFSEIEGIAGTEYADQINASASTVAQTVYGGGGNDTISGGSGSDYLDGGAGDDTILFGKGNDTVHGGDGNDYIDEVFTVFEVGDNTIYGGAGNDTIWHGAGNDLVYGGTGDDVIDDHGPDVSGASTLFGDAGNDRIFAGLDNDTAYGGADNDTLSGESGDDSLYGGTGNDSLDGGAGNDRLFGEDGDDTLSGGTGTDTLYGGAGNDALFGGDNVDTFYGGAGNDSMFGGAWSDIFVVLSGEGIDTIEGGETGYDYDTLDFNDALIGVDVTFTANEAGTYTFGGSGTSSFAQIENIEGTDLADTMDASVTTSDIDLRGYAGNDTLIGGGGADFLDGGDGDDSLSGGAGADLINAGAGNDVVAGGDGNDMISGGIGNDVIDAGAGDDFAQGESGNDTVYGGDGGDTLWGQDGDDLVYGGAGFDTVLAGNGNDTVFGGDGLDTLDGGAGNDRISGDAGDDVLTGGTGNDSFVMTDGTGNDRVTDFDLTDANNDGFTNDQIDVSALDDGAGGPVTIWNTQVVDDGRGSAKLLFPNGETLIIEGLSPAQATGPQLYRMGIPCFTAGTLIDTADGPRPIEALRPGDRVQTRDNGLQPLRWMAVRRLLAADLAASPRLRPVLIRAGALGNDAPVIVSPQHAVLVSLNDEERLVRATHLARMKGGSVRVMAGRSSVIYVHLMFDAHQVVRTQGLWSESFFPGPEALRTLGQAPMAELAALFPGLAAGSEAYGPTARILVRSRELPPHLGAFARPS